MSLPEQDATGYRLSHHLCVWCEKPLNDHNASDVFCDDPEHQHAWHQTTNGHQLGPSQPVDAADLGHTMPPGAAPASAISEPWYRPANPQETTRTVEAELRRLLGGAPASLFAGLLGVLSAAECRQLEDDYPPRPGMYAGRPAVSEYTSGPPALGPRETPGCRYALEEIGPEPLPILPWPQLGINVQTDAGYHIADRDDVVAPVRECERCGEVATPVVVRGRWAKLTPSAGVPAHEIVVIDGPRMCCGACNIHYPGPDLVPMVRHTGHRWDLLVVAGSGVVRTALSDTDVPTAARVETWIGLWHASQRGLCQWQCSLPGCGERPETWYLLGAALAWNGWRWAPTDGTPLRIGLCPGHCCELRAGLLASDARTRVRIPGESASRRGRRLMVN